MKRVILLAASFLLPASAQSDLVISEGSAQPSSRHLREVDKGFDFTIPELNVPSLYSVQISAKPAVVGARSATLTILFTSEIDLPAKSIVRVQLPRQASLAFEEPHILPGQAAKKKVHPTIFTCMIRGFEIQGNMQCEALNANVMELELPAMIEKNGNNEFVFQEIFNTPHTSEKSGSFYIQVLDEERIVIAATKPSSPGGQISGLKPAQLANVFIEQLPSESATVGEPTNVVLTVTVWHPIPAGGGVQLKLPRWDAELSASGASGSLIANENRKVECFAKMNIGVESVVESSNDPSQLNCQTNNMPQFDLVTLTGCFPKGITAGKTFSFVIKTIKNPISMTMLPIDVTTFSGLSQDPGAQPFEPEYFTGFIDEGVAEFRAKKPSPIRPSSCKLVAKNRVVQEMTNLSITFKVSVPIHGGCMLLLTVPDDFHMDSSIRPVRGWGMFQSGPQNVLSEDVDDLQRTIKIDKQCRDYTNQGATTSIQLNELKNPDFVAPSGDFKIQIYDVNNNLIAETESGLQYTPTAGPINDVTLKTLDNKQEVGQVTNLVLSFTPVHRVNKNSMIRITMPPQIAVGCQLSDVKDPIRQRPDCVEKTNNLLEFKNPFNKETTEYAGGVALGFTFKDVQLPGSEIMLKGIKIELIQLTKKDGVYTEKNLVDVISDSNFEFFAPVPVLFLYSEIRTNLQITYTETAFTFTMSSANSVPEDGIIKLELPAEVRVTDAAQVMKSCKGQSNLNRDIECKMEQPFGLGDPPTQITIKKAFRKGGLLTKQNFSFQITEGLVTPISKKSSSTFKVITTDSENRKINYIDSSLFITMKDSKDIGVVGVFTSSQIVGAISDHTISFTTPTPLYDGYYIYIFIPAQCEPPKPSELKCTSKSPMTKNLECRINGNRVTITVRKEKTEEEIKALKFSDIKFNGQIPESEQFPIPENSKIAVKITNVMNPRSTQPSDQYSVEVVTKDFYQVSSQITPGEPVYMTYPREIKEFSFSSNDQRQQALTTITIKWKNTEIYPKDVQFLIHFNPRQLKPHFENNSAMGNIPCFFRNSKKLDCEVKDSTIVIKDVLQSELQPGQQLTLTLNDIVIDVKEAATTDSWSLTSFSNGGEFQIDKIPAGLSFTYKCNYPCLTCEDGDPDKCSSCNSVPLRVKAPKNNAGYSILYDHKCYQTCPDGTYWNNYQCKKCDPMCKTCAKSSGIACTTCDVSSAWPYLDGNLCSEKCQFGWFGNKNFARCEKCKYPCESCIDNEEKCLSCVTTNVDSVFYEHKCLPHCPKGWVAPLSENQNICRKCNSNCEECNVEVDRCTKCAPGLILNKVDNNCVKKCPLGKSVHLKRTNVCVGCAANCLTCSQKPYQCTSCRENMVLDSKHKPPKCKLSCDDKLGRTVAVNGQCKPCSKSCKRCDGEPDHCTQCWDDMYFYDFTCLKKCPKIDGYQYVSNYSKKCVIEGMKCPFGYKVVPEGNGCALSLQVCENGMKLNYAKNACIPIVPENMNVVPFLLIFAFTFAIIPIVSKIIAPDSFLTSNLIAILSIFETIGMLKLLYEAWNYGIDPVTWMVLIGIVFQYLINLFFALTYYQQVCSDAAFKHWRMYNPKISTIASMMGIFFNFKVYRLLFGRLFGKDEFNAICMEPVVFYRPYLLSNILCFICTMLFVIIGSSFGLLHVFWGYQLMLTCAQMVFLEILVSVLMIVEFCIHDQMKPSTYTKIGRHDVDSVDFAAHQERRRLAVQAGNEDSDVEVEQFQKRTRQVQPAKALQAHEQMKGVLSKLKVHERDNMLKAENTAAEIQQMHEEDIMNRQLRQCRSHREYRPPFFGDDASSDEDAYNCISAPGTPRSKEMLHNRKFQGRMFNLKSSYRMGDKQDNCYHIAGAVVPLDEDKKRNVECQTNMMELLGCDDLHHIDDPVRGTRGTRGQQEESSDSENGVDTGAARRLISGVVGALDSDEGALGEGRLVRRKRIQLSTKRMAEIPPFDIEDIIGEFELDTKGNNLIIKTNDGRLNDMYGRLVNRRGYLIDERGNVITRRAIFIFYRNEIDDDDEIPAPYCYEKKKKLLFKVEAFTTYRKQQKTEKGEMQPDEYIDKEYSRLKNQMVPQIAAKQEQKQQKEVQASGNKGAAANTNKVEESMNQPEIIRSNNRGTKEDNPEDFLSQITEPFKPKSKDELVRAGAKRNPQTAQQRTNSTDHPGDFVMRGHSPKLIEELPSGHKGHDQIQMQQLEQPQMQINNLSFVGSSRQDSQAGRPPRSGKNAARQHVTMHPTSKGAEELEQLYRLDQHKLEVSEQAVKYDEEYIRKLTEFQDIMKRKEMKEMKTKQRQPSAPPANRHSAGEGHNNHSGPIFGGSVHRTFRPKRTDSQGNDSGLCLARKKLNQIYGRVRHRFNKQMRQDNTVFEHHAGLSSPIVIQDEGNAMQQRQQLQYQNAVAMQMDQPPRQTRSKQGSRRTNAHDDQRLRELQQVYQNSRGQAEHQRSRVSKHQKSGDMTGSVMRRAIDNSEECVSHQLAGITHIVDSRLQQDSRPGSAMRPQSTSNEVQRPKPDNLLSGKFL